MSTKAGQLHTVNDDRSFDDMEKKRDHILPAVAVNKDGVVAVTWYDRRESTDNLGWRVRVAASLDGGETFTASVPVSSQPNAYTSKIRWPLGTSARTDSTNAMVTMGLGLDLFFGSGGHTTGLVADANGVFHPVWVDNRTGVSQMWTAPVTIQGKAVENGSAELAELENISRKVGVDLRYTSFDRATNTATAKIRIKNVSDETITGPLKMRVVGLSSGMGTPEILGAENGISGIGAVWDLTSILPNEGLPPDAYSEEQELTFRLSNLQPLKGGREYKGWMVSMQTRVLGKTK